MVNQKEEKSQMGGEAKEEVSLNEIENMKYMSILPTVEDLFGTPPELKKNIIEGSYVNTDHYLTVQFSLLHEDFIAPLREGISKYRFPSSNADKRKTQVVVYDHVRILNASINSGKFGHVVKLAGRVRWEIITRFFIFGSLLLFTTDKFKTFFTGTVIDVNGKNGTIMVKLNGNYFKECDDIYATEFVMAVSKVFFEPYYHVLTALQSMLNEEFPMKKYIVEVSSEVEPPVYIKQLNNNKYKLFGQTQVDILNPIWPQFTEIKLNPSQQKAFQAALTNEFVAIQGPPGTGKTFIGSQIVSALIDNVTTNSPILIVCYKNHALDQFLERILSKTTSLVRIGGRSKNENLKKFNLKDQRGRYGFKLHNDDLKELAKSYFQKSYQLDGLRKHGILSIQNLLSYVMSPKVRAELLMLMRLDEWLMEGVYLGDEDKEDNEEELNVKCEIRNVCSKVSQVSIDFGSSDSLFLQENHLYSNNDLEHKNNSSCLKSLKVTGDLDDHDAQNTPFELNNSRTRKNLSESTPDLCREGESEQRFVEVYIDDYSKIYDDVSEVVEEEIMYNIDERQETRDPAGCPRNLVPYFTLTVHSLKEQHCEYERRIQSLIDNENLDVDEKNNWRLAYETDKEDLTNKISFLKRMLCKKVNLQPMKLKNIYSTCEENGIFSLSNSQRWSLYHSWVDSFAKDKKRELIKLEESIRLGEKDLDVARSSADLKILRKAKVVGVTTSGAAMNRSTLNRLGAKIVCVPVVIEEAAEVLESHIVTSLSSKCQHLILIGDHKQLRPNPAVYRLCTKFNFDISLFERMIKNGLSCHTLDVQHRMRPEFASLITPSIYPHLMSHTSTENRPDIAGVVNNLFFLDHNNPEEKLHETQSHLNTFEAKFVLQFANYLLLQGFLPEEITILATYSGQVRKIMKMKDEIIPTESDIRISTVDDFQGEENKIIILSLVRSNEGGKIGFLKTENRVCVALSRARDGLYIIGNMDCLTQSSQIWPLVKEKLVEHKAIGQTLSLYCQNHLETITQVKDGEMFTEMPEGGCKRKCETKLSCGHVCKYFCHPRDMQHSGHYMCSMPCERTCRIEHPCKKLCGEECGPCKWMVEFDLTCGHKMKAACSSDPASLLCPEILPCVLACGHESTRQCHEDEEAIKAEKKCESVCGQVRKCGHSCIQICHDYNKGVCDTILCQEDVEIKCEHEVKIIKCWQTIPKCQQKVEKTLACGHKYSASCFQFSQPIICPTKVKKMFECKHTHKVACRKSVQNMFCSAQVEKTLKCNHIHKVACGKSVEDMFCSVKVEKILKCNHTQKVACGKSIDKIVCSAKVKKMLNCSHIQEVACGESVENVFCSEMVLREVKICGHKILAKCGLKEASLVCREPCMKLLKCGHICKEECNKPCTAIVLPCVLACGHESTRYCHENEEVVAERKQCNIACGKIRQCGHPCNNYCGHYSHCDSKWCQVDVVILCDNGHKEEIKCWKQQLTVPECHQKIEKTLDCGHLFLAPCFQFQMPISCPVKVKKTLKCNHTLEVACGKSEDDIFCLQKIEKTLECKHTHNVACGLSVDKMLCPVPVEKTLKCHHRQEDACGKSIDSIICSKIVLRKVKQCGHRILAECGLNKSRLVCHEPCARILKCGHACMEECHKRCICSVVVEKKLPCGHKVKATCGSKNTVCDQPCERPLACGHKCEGECRVKCNSIKCQKLAVSKVKPACGHNAIVVPCFYNLMKPADLSKRLVALCKAECGISLQCGHLCDGECRNCRTSRAHATCSQPCKVTFPCGHRCPKKCNENCGVCYEMCLNRCSHRKCDRICGEPCRVCQEPCNRGCVHNRCRRPCFAICERGPCPLPCPNPLPCGHPCQGFCGEPCPPLCPLCRPQHPLASGRKPNDRLLILEDCKHIVNASCMDAFIFRNKGHIVKCPVVTCQTPIITTSRYHKEVTLAFSNIMKLKSQSGRSNSNDDKVLIKINQIRSQKSMFEPNQNSQNSRNQHPTFSRGRPSQTRPSVFCSRNPYKIGGATSKDEFQQSGESEAFLRNEVCESNTSSGRHYQPRENRFTSSNPNSNSPVSLRGNLNHSNKQRPFSRDHLLTPLVSTGRHFPTNQNRATTRNQSMRSPEALRGKPLQLNSRGALLKKPYDSTPTASRGRNCLPNGDNQSSKRRSKSFLPSDIVRPLQNPCAGSRKTRISQEKATPSHSEE